MIDDKTLNLQLPLPNALNSISDDVGRLRDALTALDSAVYARATVQALNDAVNALTTIINTKASTSTVNSQIAAVIGSAPAVLDTLAEVASALGNNPNLASDLTAAIASINTSIASLQSTKLNKAGDTMSGPLNLQTAALGTSDTTAVNAQFVQRALGNFSGVVTYANGVTLAAADLGKLIISSGAGGSFTLPASANSPVGSKVTMLMQGGTSTLSPAGTDSILKGSTVVTSVSITGTDWVVLSYVGSGVWVISDGTPLITSAGGATGGGSDKVFYLNDLTINTSYSIPAGKSAHSVGPISIASGKTVTVPSGSRWVIL